MLRGCFIRSFACSLLASRINTTAITTPINNVERTCLLTRHSSPLLVTFKSLERERLSPIQPSDRLIIMLLGFEYATLVAVALVAIVAFIVLWLRRITQPPPELAGIPGPPFYSAIVKSLILKQPGIDNLIPVRERYGPIYRVWAFSRWTIVVADADFARVLYSDINTFPKFITPALRTRFNGAFFGENIAVRRMSKPT